MALSGQKAVTEVRKAENDPWVDISKQSFGFSGFNYTPDIGFITTPGGGAQTDLPSGHIQGSASLTVLDNATTRPLLWNNNGKPLQIRHHKEGKVADKPYQIFRCQSGVAVDAPSSGAITYNVTLEVLEVPEDGTN